VAASMVLASTVPGVVEEVEEVEDVEEVEEVEEVKAARVFT